MGEIDSNSKVNIREAGTGYLIEVEDQFGENIYAVTPQELESIVLIGGKLLKDNPPL